MKLKVIFKGETVVEIDDVKNFGIKGDAEGVLRVDTNSGKTHFINFHEVLACLEVKEETE